MLRFMDDSLNLLCLPVKYIIKIVFCQEESRDDLLVTTAFPQCFFLIVLNPDLVIFIRETSSVETAGAEGCAS